MPTVIYWGTNGLRRPPTRRERLVEFAVRAAVTAVAVWVAAQLVGGIVLEGWGATVFAAVILGLLNALLRPVLVLGALPLIVLTLGIGLIVINAALLGLAAWLAGVLGLAFEVHGFWAAFLGAVVISLVSFLLTRFIKPREVARNMR